MEFPKGLKYTQNDEWIRVENGTGTVGITDFAQDQLSDVVYLEITVSVGDAFKQGDVLAEIESVKAAAEIYAPVDGEITQVNEALTDAPETVNADAYGEAWLVQFEISDPSQLDGLMDSAAYEAYIHEREG